MRSLIGLLALGLVAADQALSHVEAPPGATGRVIVRGDEQIATRHVDGRFAIVARRRTTGGWSELRAIVAAPAGTAAFASALSPDGRRLLFESNHRSPPDASREDTDVWIIERDGDTWNAARPIGGAWASPANEHAPSMAADGTVCLNSARPAGMGENDIYCAASIHGSPRPALTLNSPAEDAFAVLDPSGDAIVFASNRPGGHGGWDLYAARRDGASWAGPVNLGAAINSSADELHPWLDGETLYFVRPGPPRQLLARARWRPFEAARARASRHD